MPVITCAEIELSELKSLLQRFQMELIEISADETIPGSFWGDSEAGLVDNRLLIRPDTPLHSALHEACHFICMDQGRRDGLHTDAGGDYDEENGVCYLQILLSDHINGIDRQRMMADMDAWGYSFRLGSAERWFHEDADDAHNWLRHHGLIDEHSAVTWRLRP